ncbi:MAG: 30S ribosomal protein S6 [Limisphaerales bacterium]
MQTYETTLILSPILPETEWEAKVSKYEGLITAAGGEIKKKELWGVRKLAYPISHRAQGYYVFFQYQAPGELPRELERNIRLDEEILRHLTVVAKPTPTRPEPPAPELQEKGVE